MSCAHCQTSREKCFGGNRLRTRKSLLAGLVVSVLLCATGAIAQTIPPEWKALDSLTGSWAGDGGGAPGQGSGAFSFHSDLQGRILMRTSFAEYPATKDRPAFRHDDLTIVYREGSDTKAIYFDNEGHVIHYAVSASPDGHKILFVSDLQPGAPRYRLTYEKTGENAVHLTFEIAPPGHPDEFRTYVQAAAHRTAGKQ